MVHHLRNNGILLELMYEQCDLWVKHEAFYSAAPVDDSG